MNRCPHEILLQIFGLACDDDGSTGRALSLVSRNVHELSKEFKYQSIAIVGLLRLVSFAAVLQDLQEPSRRVRHLFFSSIAQNLSGKPKRITEDLQNYRDTCDAFSKVMRIVAPTLVTCQIVFQSARMVTLIPESCPCLTDLSLVGPFPTLPGVDEAPRFPSLRSLTFSSFTDYPSCLFDDIATQAPNLQNLAFYPAQACRNFAGDLAKALNAPTSSRSAPDPHHVPRPALPNTIKQVTVQPGTEINRELRNAYCKQSVQALMERKLTYMQKNHKRCQVECVAPGRPQTSPQDTLSVWLLRSHD
ncbi:hypothetical protein EST38_g1958 [Candolleomyces aberdarensis]|uniref:F-box domain-containing protein n=1 Tax=Candolleomyces aberdarensis TaxID=2316362 RepID=A0A4Q2DW81_9AGAR|nr:hypothetical protein EST38_g1958 [Candolleomyces aberdarensis]